ncbi:MAG: glycoside hydrolase family 2 TIM barrel-domain containing protein [Bacteroidota bacterium]|nr:glycoside hydrolase family 2 TIM barrel-domain containing protein [Bacteroidota bacterium]
MQNIMASAIGFSLLPGASLANNSELLTPNEQSLAGQWKFRLDPGNNGEADRWFDQALTDNIQLPGSCEQRGFGVKTTIPEVERLTRSIKYEGAAWYQRIVEVPDTWNGKRLELFLERCHWASSVWLDGKLYGSQSSLSAPHLYDLGIVSPGKHTLSIRIDNSYKLAIGKWGFAITDDTQGNWNGIIGKITWRATDLLWIRDVQVYAGHLQVKIGNATGEPQQAGLLQQTISIPVGGGLFNIPFQAGTPWDEFSPRINSLTLVLHSTRYTDRKTISYGLSMMTAEKGQFRINGRPVMMRGPVNECVYPLTGYPPMDKKSWTRVLQIVQSYGFNFMRFNSWCPPEAAFQAADDLGIFLQIEIPFWSMGAPEFGEDEKRDQFLLDELYLILDSYGNHPSFAFMAMGNESGGPMEVLVNKGRKKDGRRLYRCQNGDVRANGDYAERGTEIGQRGIKGPRTDWDRWSLIDDPDVRKYQALDLPTLAHEVGQWSSYPDFGQLPKFTGTLKPHNYERFQRSLAEHEMLDQNKVFALESGKFAVSLYKEEIEGCLRTYPHGGFQIVEARDFPGEGCAIIGWLDAFWDSKGLITPEAFRRFCGPTVCLLRMPRRIYTSTETFVAKAEIAHYGPGDIFTGAQWKIESTKDKLLYSGAFPKKTITTGKLNKWDEIKVSLNDISEPAQLIVSLCAGGNTNHWNIWVYPEIRPVVQNHEVHVTNVFDPGTRQALSNGARVVLFSSPKQGLFEIKREMLGPDATRQFPPVTKGKNAIPGSFMPAFWNLRLFNQIGTLSILCDPEHPALSGFPTESHSDWQWADILGRFTAMDSYEIAGDEKKHDWGDVSDRSKCIILNETPADYRPIVQMIDNYERNYKLGLIFETRVGKGKLLICALDLDTDADSRPAARQLKNSLLNYAVGPAFNPTHELPVDFLERALT